MKKRKILYALTAEDVVNISNEEKMPFKVKDLPFIKEKIGDYFGDKWQDAIKYALIAVKKK